MRDGLAWCRSISRSVFCSYDARFFSSFVLVGCSIWIHSFRWPDGPQQVATSIIVRTAGARSLCSARLGQFPVLEDRKHRHPRLYIYLHDLRFLDFDTDTVQ